MRVPEADRQTSLTRRQEDPSRRSRTVVVSLLLFGACLAVFAVTGAYGAKRQVSMDAWSANYEAWTVATTGQPWIDGDRIPQLDDNEAKSTWEARLPNGHTVITRAPGTVAVSIPAYAILRPDSMTTTPGAMTAALLMAGAILLLFLALAEHLPIRRAALCAGLLGVATPVWSVAADDVWPHTVTILGVCGMAWACATKRWWWVGVFGGISVWGRLPAALIVAVIGLHVGFRRNAWSITAKIAVPGLALLALMCAWTRWMYGTWNPTGSYDTASFSGYAEEHRLDIVNQLGFWISPDRGILVWTPVILLLLPALARSWRLLPDWARSLAVGGVVYTILQGILNRFSGGENFYGYRYGLECLACITPALALSTPRIGRLARPLLGPVLAVQTYAIAVGAITNSHFLLETEKWHHNAFVSATNQTGVGGWIVVAIVAALGITIQLWWRRRVARGDDTSTISSDLVKADSM